MAQQDTIDPATGSAFARGAQTGKATIPLIGGLLGGTANAIASLFSKRGKAEALPPLDAVMGEQPPPPSSGVPVPLIVAGAVALALLASE
jgi:hypothetical protein